MSTNSASDPVPTGPVGRPWWQRWAFGFLFCYFVLYGLPFPLKEVAAAAAKCEATAAAEQIGGWVRVYESKRDEAVVLVGTECLDLKDLANTPSGSGDTRFDYVQVLAMAAAAAAFGLLLLLVDWRGRTIGFLHAMLRIYVRYVLAAAMLRYGFHKVFPLQFGVLDGEWLYGTYGNASPMNLVWTFLAASPAYTIFSGAMEVLAGLLLLFRRTTTLGAVVAIAVLTNVAMLNFCYDVPVKLYSSHLFAMALLLAAGDGRRLLAVLLTNRATAPVVLRRPMPMWLLAPIQLVKLALAGWLVWTTAAGNWEMWQARNASPAPLQGIWEATEFSLVGTDGQAAPPRAHWHHLTIVRYRPTDPIYLTIGLLGYEKQMAKLTIDSEHHVLHLEPIGSAAGPAFDLTYEERTGSTPGAPEPAPQLVVTGQLDGRELRAVLQKREPASFPVHDRGFRWVQEFPFNSNR